mmetsp:Transcript_12771/g.30406  ORF Transcript_12771/g.30406 Transcript_12771/m.30406 type:complete len:203 (+) Transcript_12771:93-701(+)
MMLAVAQKRRRILRMMLVVVMLLIGGRRLLRSRGSTEDEGEVCLPRRRAGRLGGNLDGLDGRRGREGQRLGRTRNGHLSQCLHRFVPLVLEGEEGIVVSTVGVVLVNSVVGHLRCPAVLAGGARQTCADQTIQRGCTFCSTFCSCSFVIAFTISAILTLLLVVIIIIILFDFVIAHYRGHAADHAPVSSNVQLLGRLDFDVQ